MSTSLSPAGFVVCIVGPTASGKSELSERVAKGLGSAVVSIDAMQVYRGMDVGTAKTPPERRRVPLLMVDVEDVAHDYSVQRFQSDARACIDELLEHGLTPVLAGGTGLYLNAVIDEMQFPAGKLGDERRTHYEDYAREKGPDALYALLAERDPKSAELIHPNNTKRVVRALEMLDEGVSYAEHHAGLSKRAPHYEAHIWGLTMERSRLYQRIDERVDEMFSAGLVDEVRRLRGQGLSREHTAGQAIGYKEILDALDGTCTIDEARAAIKLRTRRYAKRQLSWFRHDERVQWINLDYASLDEAAEVVLRDARDSREGVGAHESL